MCHNIAYVLFKMLSMLWFIFLFCCTILSSLGILSSPFNLSSLLHCQHPSLITLLVIILPFVVTLHLYICTLSSSFILSSFCTLSSSCPCCHHHALFLVSLESFFLFYCHFLIIVGMYVGVVGSCG